MNTAMVIGMLVMIGAFFLARGKTISGSDARAMVADGAKLIDVRTPTEYAQGHIEGAVNVPLQSLQSGIGKLDLGKDDTVVVYCRSGARSASAKRELEGMGFTSVHNLGGIGSW